MIKWIVHLAILAVFISRAAAATTWYVDVDNVSGTTNGNSWATAWVRPADVVWASISAGDTIEISDGLYTNGFNVGQSGTFGNPITIKKSRAIGHTGVALIVGDLIAGFADDNFLVIDGGLDDSFVAPTNAYQVIDGATAVTNNVGLVSSNGQVGFYSNKPFSGVEIRWCGVKSATNHATVGESHMFSFPISTAGRQTNNIIEYCAGSISWADAIQWTGGSLAEGPGEKIIRLSVFAHIGDDGVEGNHGIWLDRCVLGPFAQRSGHADGIQTAGDYWAMTRCWIRDGGLNSSARVTIGYGDTSPLERITRPMIANNLFTFGEFPAGGSDPNGGIYVYPTYVVEMVNYNPQNLGTNYVWDGAVVANNTVYGFTNTSPVFDWVFDYPDEDGGPLTVTNWFITNSIIANNLVVECNKGLGGASWDSDLAFPPYGSHYQPVDLRLDWNIVTATNGSLSTPKGMTYRGTSYTDGSAMAAAEEWNNNGTNYPRFVDAAAKNFDLASNDTAARKRGTNLWSYGVTNDFLGRSRSSSEPFSVGAFDPSDLIIHLDFEAHVDASDSITNLAGLGPTYNGFRFGYTNTTPAGSNFPNRVSASSTPGTNGSTWAGQFDWYTDGFGDYERSGDYIGFTNMHLLTNMSAATIMFRGRYRPLHAGSNYTSDANAQFLSAGSAVNTNLGGWDFGRWNQAINANETRFIVATNSNQSSPQVGSEGDRFFGKAGRLVCNFPDGYAPIVSDSTNWAHYAITFNLGVIVAYYNGTSIGTNDISGSISNLTLGARWLCVGCNTHTGQEPYLDDGESPTLLPNNGWLNGDMDDLKIANRAFSAEEICSESGYGDCAQAEAGSSSAVTRSGRIRGIRWR